jgi:hypothetical protein
MASQCPLDVWDTILSYLTRDNLRSTLLVSSQFHTISQRLLFCGVTLTFGAWETLTSPFNDRQRSPVALEISESKTLEILDCIAHDGQFARTIRHIIIRSYSHEKHRIHRGTKNTLYDHHCHCEFTTVSSEKLLIALRSLGHLQSFEWFGIFPSISADVAHELVASCSQLKKLRMPGRVCSTMTL